jgi:ribonuclease D
VDLQTFAERARATGRLGIDTEFMGEGRYRSLLCVVQVAVERDDGDSDVEVLDALDPTLEPAPLAAVLADPAVEVVMHAGRQDVALLRRTWGTGVTSIFDTQVAAGFTGRGAQMGYEALLHDVLGVRLRKSASFTRWDARPLTDEQISYAREDVLQLVQLADALQRDLDERGRLEWAREECRALESVSDTRDLDAVFGKLPRIGRASTRRSAPSRASWSSGARRPRSRPTSPSRRCCPTRRWSRSPGGARATSGASSRSAGSTSRRCVGAGATSWRRSSAGATASRSPATATSRSPPTRATGRRSRCARR